MTKSIHRHGGGSPGPRFGLWIAILGSAVGLALGGCPGPDNPYRPYPEPDYNEYVGVVQPIVERSCSNLGCHGDVNRRLTLYSVAYARAEPAVPGAPLDSDHLSLAELAWNYDGLRARLIDEESADDALLLLKCLDPEEGGIEHADGEVVFWSTDEPDYIDFRDWIETGL